jgi:hypothetical protein
MRKTLLLLLSMPTLLFSQSNTLCSVNEKDMGTWAFIQHTQLSEKIIASINSRSIQIYETEKLKMSEKKMSEKLYNLVTVFIQTDMNNPEIGKDSVMGFFKEEFIKSFKMSKDFFEFNTDVFRWMLSKKEVYKFCTPDQLLYIDRYSFNNTIHIDSIPNKSKTMINTINQNLVSLCRSGMLTVFQNDSLLSKISREKLKKHGMYETPIALPLNDEEWLDSSIEVDATIFNKNMTCNFFYNLEYSNFQFYIKSISPSAVYTLQSFEMPAMPAGYLKYNEALTSLKSESELINSLIVFTTCLKASHYQLDKEDYKNYFTKKAGN